MKTTTNQFVRYFRVLLLLFIISGGSFFGFQLKAQSILDGESQPKFVNPLPIPPVLDKTQGGTDTIHITQFEQDLGIKNPQNGSPMLTTVWGYNGTYPGPTILARKNVPVSIYWWNELVDGNEDPLPHLLPVDTTLHWALHDVPGGLDNGIPIVTHLHGGKTESASDGLPEAWYTPGFTHTGMDFVKGETEPYYYANDQEAATIWYHDHALGITRLNVYSGLAGFYLLRDANEEAMISANQLPSGEYEVGLAIQDKMFFDNGQLHYPAMSEMGGHGGNSVMPEFFGDVILVNGMAWPYMDVEPRPYRFRMLNGSDSRFYNLYFSDSITFHQIGSDMGFLQYVNPVKQLLIAPGERMDVVLDFSNPALWGKTIILKNNAREPFPRGDNINSRTVGQIMAFRVTKPLNTSVPRAVLPAQLRPAIQPLVPDAPTRKLILFEGEDEMGRLQPLLGTTDLGGLLWSDPITENPELAATEIWEFYNITPDAHPVHIHGVAFQVVDRQRFKANVDEETGVTTDIRLIGTPRPPAPGERGWKDTAPAYPGEVLRVKVKFELPGLYAWHCHILSHEDHEMMRPYFTGDMTLMSHRQSTALPLVLELHQNVPNPFSDFTRIDFNLSNSGHVKLEVFDMTGRRMHTVLNEIRDAGDYYVYLNSGEWKPGIYMYVLTSNGETISRRMIRQ